MSVFIYQAIFLFSYLVTRTVSLFLTAGEISTECSGSLHIYDGAEVHTFTASVDCRVPWDGDRE